MANFFNIPKNQTGYYMLAAVMCLFIVLPIQVPHEFAALIDSNLGKIVIVVITLNMFLAHPLVGSVGIIAAYELVKRSARHGRKKDGARAPVVPTPKTENLNKFNQFPITVEEIVIKQKIPYSFNISNPASHAPYVPIAEDVHDASSITNLFQVDTSHA